MAPRTRTNSGKIRVYNSSRSSNVRVVKVGNRYFLIRKRRKKAAPRKRKEEKEEKESSIPAGRFVGPSESSSSFQGEQPNIINKYFNNELSRRQKKEYEEKLVEQETKYKIERDEDNRKNELIKKQTEETINELNKSINGLKTLKKFYKNENKLNKDLYNQEARKVKIFLDEIGNKYEVIQPKLSILKEQSKQNPELIKKINKLEQEYLDMLSQGLVDIKNAEKEFVELHNELHKPIYESEIKEKEIKEPEEDLSQIELEEVPEQQGEGKIKMTKDGISNFDINKIMNSYTKDGYLGCIASDEIESKILPHVKPHSRLCFVMNTDKASGPGEHWVSCYIDARPHGDHTVEYFNSFGEPPTDSFLEDIWPVIKKLDPDRLLKFKWNQGKFQAENSVNCGPFACQFLTNRLRGNPFIEASGWKDVKGGEASVEKFKKNHGIESFGMINHKGSGLKEIFGNMYHGQGVFDKLKELVFGRTEAPNDVKRLIENHGQAQVKRVVVNRVPVNSTIKKILNLASAGELESQQKKFGYDEIFHLSLSIWLSDGYSFKIERNETIKVSGANSEGLEVPGQFDTLDQFLGKPAEKYGANFWRYNAVNNNCQDFCLQVLETNGVLTPELRKFIKQDAAGLIGNSTVAQGLANSVTGFAHRLGVLIGRGKRDKIQSVVFKKSNWTARKAEEWLEDHGLKVIKIDETPNTYRFRQQEPNSSRGYYTKDLKNGILLILFEK